MTTPIGQPGNLPGAAADPNNNHHLDPTQSETSTKSTEAVEKKEESQQEEAKQGGVKWEHIGFALSIIFAVGALSLTVAAVHFVAAEIVVAGAVICAILAISALAFAIEAPGRHLVVIHERRNTPWYHWVTTPWDPVPCRLFVRQRTNIYGRVLVTPRPRLFSFRGVPARERYPGREQPRSWFGFTSSSARTGYPARVPSSAGVPRGSTARPARGGGVPARGSTPSVGVVPSARGGGVPARGGPPVARRRG